LSQKRPDRPPVVVPLIGLVLLVFLAGTAVAEFRVFPYEQLLRPAFMSLRAELYSLEIQRASPSELGGEAHWRPARTAETGVTRHVPAESWGDYTVYTSTHASAAYLVDPAGAVVHEWALPFYEAFPEPDHLDGPVGEDRIFWSNALVFPDGSLLTRYGARGDTPYGYGLVKLDRDSRVLWRFSGTSHHDIQVDEDGTILTLTHRFRTPDESDLLRDLPLDDRILDDEVVRLSADGEVLERVSLADAFAGSDFRWVLESTFLEDDAIPRWDLLHANAARPVPDAWAAHHPFAEAGWWLVSLRSPSLLALVDPETERVRWFSRSFWRFQHDPHMLDDGNLILVDNQGHGGAGSPSRLVELDPATGALAWSYAGTAEEPFYSEYSSHLQLLPGGNVLVTEANAGRIFEVTRDGRIVWEFWNPERAEEDGRPFVASVADAKRYAAEELPFLEAR
jgi:outer membrane protein assembly factor BamB